MMNITKFSTELRNESDIMFTNGLNQFKLIRLDDEIMLICGNDSLTWDYTKENIRLTYSMYIELVNGYNSLPGSRGYDAYHNEANRVKMAYVA